MVLIKSLRGKCVCGTAARCQCPSVGNVLTTKGFDPLSVSKCGRFVLTTKTQTPPGAVQLVGQAPLRVWQCLTTGYNERIASETSTCCCEPLLL